MTTRAELPDPALAQREAEAARRMRSAWLLGIESGQATWLDLINAATRKEGKPLRRIRIEDLITAASPMTATAVNRRMRSLRKESNVAASVADSRLTVGWLLRNDSTPGRRLAILCDLMERTPREREDKTLGFPYTVPVDLQRVWR